MATVLMMLMAWLGMAACGGGGDSAPAAPAEATPAPQAQAAPPANTAKAAVATRHPGIVVLGYQGWFGCPGDFEQNTEWLHWFQGAPSPRSLLVDMMPSLEGLDDEDLCDTGLPLPGGGTLKLFSSQNAKIVDRHFQQMARQGVGAVAVQRFVTVLQDARHRRRADNVLRHVMAAAARHGLPFYLSYDLTGADPATAARTVREDWQALTSQWGLARLPAYFRDEQGRPLVQLWGLGFAGYALSAQDADGLVADLRAATAPGLPASVVGGVPSGWRTLSGDASPDPAWSAVYAALDVVSPWTVGRYQDAQGADRYFADKATADMAQARSSGQDFMPVIFPGFSWANLMQVRGASPAAAVNAIPRECGTFLTGQANLAIAAQPRLLYLAMFDELDEGTALMPSQPGMAGFPVGARGVALDADGCALSDDWYLQAVGRIVRALGTRDPQAAIVGL